LAQAPAGMAYARGLGATQRRGTVGLLAWEAEPQPAGSRPPSANSAAPAAQRILTRGPAPSSGLDLGGYAAPASMREEPASVARSTPIPRLRVESTETGEANVSDLLSWGAARGPEADPEAASCVSEALNWDAAPATVGTRGPERERREGYCKMPAPADSPERPMPRPDVWGQDSPPRAAAPRRDQFSSRSSVTSMTASESGRGPHRDHLFGIQTEQYRAQLQQKQMQQERKGETSFVSSNAYASGANQNSGNYLTDRRMTRVNAPPGGHSSICLG